MMKNFSKTIQNVSVTLLALAVGLILSLKSGDIVNNKLTASGCRDRDFLGYIRFFVAFIVPVLLWFVIFLTTTSTTHQARRQIRYCTGIGVVLAIIAGELVAFFTFIVRYV